MRKFLTGAAILSLIATAAPAKPGGGGGGDNRGGNPHAGGPPGQAADRGNDNGNSRGNDGLRGPGKAREDRGPGRDAKGAVGPARMERAGHGQGPQERIERSASRFQRPELRPGDRNPGGGGELRRSNPGRPGNTFTTVNEAERARAPSRAKEARAAANAVRIWGDRNFRHGARAIEGCPPGLAKKDNGCMPPGLAAKEGRSSAASRIAAGAAGASLLAASYSPAWFGYHEYGPDYRYYDGYLLRTSGERVLGYVPLLGGALSIGAPWPAYYEAEPLPPYWVDYYDLGPAQRYRYYDDVIYELDPDRSDIDEIVALMTGDPWAVGRAMPVGYDVYNVPYSYRTRYYDGPAHWYRYSDGYLYDIDPTTRLVLAVIQLLA